jgi:hypothetical protein
VEHFGSSYFSLWHYERCRLETILKKLGCLLVAEIPQKFYMADCLSSKKNLFTLGFTVEMPLVESDPTDDLLGEDLDDRI